MRFDVRLVREAAGVRGTLQVVGQPTGARELSAPSCREAADALALVAALMLGDPNPEARSSEPTRSEARSVKRSDARSSNQAASGDANARPDETPSSAGPTASSQADPVSAPLTADSELNADSAPSSISTATPTVAAMTAPAVPSQRLLTDWRLRVALGAILAWGMPAPLGLGPNLSIGASARPTAGGPRYSLEIGARGAYPHQIRIPEGKATFRWVAFTTSLCIEGPQHRFSVAGCALLETGWLEANSKDGVTPRERSRFWGAVGPALLASALFHPKFGVRLSGELLGVLVRDRFFLADRLLYSVPSLAFRAGLSLYFSLW